LKSARAACSVTPLPEGEGCTFVAADMQANLQLSWIRLSAQAAERIDQHQNRKRYTEQPQQQITSHEHASLRGLNGVSIPAREDLFQKVHRHCEERLVRRSSTSERRKRRSNPFLFAKTVMTRRPGEGRDPATGASDSIGWSLQLFALPTSVVEVPAPPG
jgi:hypothetical protein